MHLIRTCSSCISSVPEAQAAYVPAAVAAVAAAAVAAAAVAVPTARPAYRRLLLVSSHTPPRCVLGVPLAALM